MKLTFVARILLGSLAIGVLAGCSKGGDPVSSDNQPSNPANPSSEVAPSSLDNSDNVSSEPGSSAAPSSVAPSSAAPSSAAPSSAAPSSAAPSSAPSSAQPSSSSTAPSSSSEAPSSSAAPSSSVAPLDLSVFPASIVNQYFEREIGMGVDLPNIELTNNRQFTIGDGYLGGPSISCFYDEGEPTQFKQAFYDEGWFITQKLSGGEVIMNFLGFTEAYVDIMIGGISIDFIFFVSDIPDEDPSLNPIPVSGNPFPGSSVVDMVYTPNNITVQMPEFYSDSGTFSLANPRPGVSIMVTASGLTASEKADLLAAFVTAGWAFDEANSRYVYGSTRAYFTVAGTSRMTMFTFALLEEQPAVDPKILPTTAIEEFFANSNIAVTMPAYTSGSAEFSVDETTYPNSIAIKGEGVDSSEETAITNAFKACGWIGYPQHSPKRVYRSTRAHFMIVYGNTNQVDYVFGLLPESNNVFPSDDVISTVYAPNNIDVFMPYVPSETITFTKTDVWQDHSISVVVKGATNDEETCLLIAFLNCGWTHNSVENKYIFGDTDAYFTLSVDDDGAIVYTFNILEAPATVFTYTITDLPDWIQNDGCVIFAWYWSPGAWKKVEFDESGNASFTCGDELTGFLLARCHADTVTPDWAIKTDIAGRVYNQTEDINCTSGVYSYSCTNWKAYPNN